jgi:hypothetical protein
VEEDEVDDIPDWEAELIEIARAVLADDRGDRFAEIPQIESRDSFSLMRDFISQLSDGPARERLEGAIAGAKPFRRFKGALMEFPDLREQWFAFEASAKEALARQWLDEIGVDVIEP